MGMITTDVPKNVAITVYGDDQPVYQGQGGLKKKPFNIIIPGQQLINPDH